ncbi:RDD family protein [Wolbachia endosymbiont of Folsomia candida]|uniref:RDD family protein n=1 Tax=Wolbachia endosymbiont of Folsomia candida TaxID=169402 RepID=UPI000B24AA50|nr:RDD family protein [Wolbachia endosymbiont of Folsomia candida]APR98373.1 RDD family protein [Wolbachia endosymbiont of Folsomia candida]
MDITTDIRVIYVGFTRRTVAVILDSIIFFFPLFILYIALSGNNEIYTDFLDETKQLTSTYTIFTSVLCAVLEILMITRLGGTPGKLLCGIYVKDVNTFTNVTLIQATIRCVSQTVFSIISSLLCDYVSRYSLILPILVLIFAIFDQRKQTFYDKLANTVVIGCKPN